MNRKDFFIKSALMGGAISFLPNIAANATEKSNNEKNEQQKTIDKVTLAMLSMQRASWEQGTAAQAIYEIGNTGLLYLMAKEAVLRQLQDGRLAVVYTDNGNTDPGSAGEAVLQAYKLSGDEDLKLAADKMLDYFLTKAPRNSDGIIYHTLNSPEIWSDSFYMAAPFIAATGKYNEAMKQINGVYKILWNSEHKLFSHRWHDGEKRFINQRFWGGGNGWAAASFSRVIRLLPDNMQAEKNMLATYHKQSLDGCIAHMRPDGLFHDFVNEPSTFVETNLSQMLAYSIFRGVKGGWLDKSYLEPAQKMREAAYKKIDKNGYVTDVCGAPYFGTPGRSTEGQAFFLLMEAAYNAMSNG